MGQKKEETTIVRKQKSSSISRALRIALALLLAVTLTPATALPAFADEVDVAEAEAAELEHGNAAESSGTDSEPVGREQNPVVEEEPQPGGTQTEEQGTDSDPVGRELTPVVEEEPQPGGSEGTIETLSETVSLGLGLSAKLDPTEAWLHDNDGIRTLVLPMHLSGTVSQTGFLHYEISTGNDSIAFIGDWEDDNYTNQRMLPVLKRSSGSNELSMALLLEFEILPGVEIDNIDFSSFSIVNNGSEAGFSVEYSDTPVSDSNGLTHSIEYLSSWHYVEEIGRSLRVLHGPINHNDEDSIYITNGVWPIEVNVGGVGTASKSGTLSYHLGSSNVEQQEEYRISVRAGDEYKWAYPSVMVSADAVITLDSVEFTPSPITLVGLEGLQDPIGLGNGLTAAFNPNSFYLYPIDEGGYNLYFSFEVEGEPQATGIHAYSVGTGNNVFDADPYNRNLSSSFTVLSDDPDTGYENTVSRTIYCYVQVSSDDTSMTIDLSEFSVGSDGFYPGYRVMADRTQTVQANEMDHRIYGFYGGIWINDESQEGSEEKHLSVSSPINVRISTGNYEDDGENPIIVVVAPRGATIEAEIEVTGTPEVPSGAFTYTLLGEGVAMIDNGSYPANSSNHYVPFSISQDTEVTLEVDFTAYPVTLVGLNDLQGPFGFGNGLTAAFNPNSFHLSEIDDGGYNLYFSFEVEGEPQATGIHAYSIGIGNHEFVADPYNGNLSSSFAVLGDDPDIGFENTVSRTIGCYVQVSSDDSPMIIDLSEFTIQSDGFYLGYRVMADRTDTVRENGMDHRIESFSGGIWIDDESQEGSEERYVQASSPINVRTSTDNNEDDDDNSVIVVVAPRGATIEAEIKVTGTPEVPSGAFTYTLSGVGVGMIDSESYPASSGYHHVPFNISQDTEVTLEVGFSAYPVTLIGLEDLKGPFDLGNGIEAVFDPNSFHVSEHYDGGYYLGFNLLLTGQPMQTGTHLYSFNTGTNVFDSGSDGGQNTYDQFVVLGEDPITGYENNVSSARGFSLRISGNDSPMEIDLSELGLELIEFFPGYRAMADRNDTVTNNGMEHGISGLGGAVWTDDDIVIWIDTPINTYNDEASFDEQESKIVVVVPRIAGAGASIEMTGIPDAQGLFTYTLYGQGISVVTNESCAPYTTGYVGFLLTQDTVVTLGVDFTPTPFEIIGQVQDLDLGNGLWARVDTQRVTASIQSSSGGSDDRWIVSVPVDISGSAQEHAIHQVTLDYSQLSSLLTPTQTYNDYTTEGFGVLQGEIPEWRGEAWRILNFFVDLSGEQPVVLDLSKLELTTTPFEPAWVLRVDSTPVEDGDSNATHWLDDAYHQDYSGYVINQTDYNQWITLVPSSLDGELRLRFAQTPLIGGTSIESGMATYTLLANGDPLNTDEPLTCYISQSNWSDTSWSYLNINSSILASLALGSGVVELQLGAVQFEEFSVTFTGEGSLVPLLNSGLTATVQELDDFNPVYQDADGRIWVYFELNISGTVAEPQVWSFCPSTLASTNANLDFSELDLIFFALVPGEVNDSLVFRVPLIEAKTTVVTLGDIALDGLEVKKGGMHRLSLIPAAEEGVSFHPYFEYNSVIVAGAPSKNSNGFGFAPSVDPDEVDLWFALNGTGYDYCAMEGTYLSLYAYYFGYPELTGLYEYQLTINGDPVGGKQSAQLVANNESAYGGADDLHTLTITEDTTVSISVTPPSDDPEPVYVFSTSANTVSLSSTTPSTTVTITSTKDSVAHDWSVQSSPAWLTATATNNTTLTLSIGGQPPATDQTDTVTIKQNDSDNTVSIEVSYTAPTQQISYTISYSANGGTGTVGSQDVTQGASFTTRANAFTRAGYTFSGWNTAADGGGSAYAANTSIVNNFTANTTLYAQWAANTNTAYKVEHYKVSSTGVATLDSTQNLTGTTATTATAAAQTITGFTQDTTHSSRVASGAIAGDGSLVLKLYYKANSYTVSYNANGGTGSLGAQAATYGESYKIRANTFKRTGYTFSGWNTAANGSGKAFGAAASFTYNFTANTTLYAQWKPNTNTAYKVEHYKVSSTGKVTLAATQNLKGTTAAKVTAQARSFTGFTQDTKHRQRVATGTISANGTLTLKLYYKVNSYTITYAPNGGAGTSVKQTVYYGESFKVRAASTFKRSGYTFAGWNTLANGSGKTYNAGSSLSYQIAGNTTLRAQWKQAGTIALSYTTHVQSVGWQDFVKEGEMSGTSGRALRLEGIKINLQNTTGISGGISYATHVQSIGWQSKVSLSSNGNNKTAVNGPMSGTSGRALRLEAITIELTGDLKKHYDIYYRVHAQSVGWMGWARNGQEAGTAGHAYRLEGIQILLVPKVGGKAPGNVYKGIITPAGTPKFIKK